MRWLAIGLLVACKAKEDPTPQPPVVVAIDAAPPADAPKDWPELAKLPATAPTKVVHLNVQTKIPRFEVAGPTIAGDVAIVASSQFGFAAVDWRSGAVAWTKAAGMHVAPPYVAAANAYLIAECPQAIEVPPNHQLLGCLRTVTFAGQDLSYIAIHGDAPAFAAANGTQDVWKVDDKTVRWRRGDAAITIDLMSGLAKPAASIEPPPIHVAYKDHAWDIKRVVDDGPHTDAGDASDPHGAIVATDKAGKVAWTTKHPYSVLVGGVYLPEQSPMVRVLRVGPFGGIAEVNVLDIDATGSLHGQAAFPVPGIAVLDHAVSTIGDTAMVVRLDASLRHDYVAGYAANALLLYVWPLPDQLRADAVGIAIAPEAVVVFHDGDTVTILPELSAPPTAPGAARAPLQIPTP